MYCKASIEMDDGVRELAGTTTAVPPGGGWDRTGLIHAYLHRALHFTVNPAAARKYEGRVSLNLHAARVESIWDQFTRTKAAASYNTHNNTRPAWNESPYAQYTGSHTSGQSSYWRGSSNRFTTAGFMALPIALR